MPCFQDFEFCHANLCHGPTQSIEYCHGLHCVFLAIFILQKIDVVCFLSFQVPWCGPYWPCDQRLTMGRLDYMVLLLLTLAQMSRSGDRKHETSKSYFDFTTHVLGVLAGSDNTYLYPPKRSLGGVYWIHPVRPSVRPSVRPWVGVRMITLILFSGFKKFFLHISLGSRSCMGLNISVLPH